MGFFTIRWGNKKPNQQSEKDKELLDLAVKQYEANAPLPNTSGRSSQPHLNNDTLFSVIKGEMDTVKPGFDPKLIEICEFLAMYNGDVSYAVDNVVQLGNTNATISFDDSVSKEQKKEMLKYLKVAEQTIYTGGINSLQNDLFAQAVISGALSAEMIPFRNLKGIDKVALVPPKFIVFKYNDKTYSYDPYQRIEDRKSVV